MSEQSRRCSRCHHLYEPDLAAGAFQLQRREDISSLRKRICRPCEQDRRDGRKRDDRWIVKARDVVRRHAARLSQKWPDITTADDLVRTYGWEPRQLAHDAEFQYNNGCSYCGESYHEMGHGLSDITLDVQDPSRRPFYRTNTKWCCQTCNRRKGSTDPEQFELDRRIWAAWAAHRARGFDPLKDDPDSLFYEAG